MTKTIAAIAFAAIAFANNAVAVEIEVQFVDKSEMASNLCNKMGEVISDIYENKTNGLDVDTALKMAGLSGLLMAAEIDAISAATDFYTNITKVFIGQIYTGTAGADNQDEYTNTNVVACKVGASISMQ